ncbi:MAG: diacylglycerol kinase family lipid kinase, partial [Hyphomicrobiales bacterium]|nr:diacylglycerol kinase family lipid kinase [Hyphomicrobiales bacterium]
MTQMRVTTRRVLIVANPKARGYAPRKLAAIRDALARDGVAVDLMQSQARGDIERIVADIGSNFDVIAVHGGDGTINEAIAGLRTIPAPQPALAIIAGGTANVLASETRAARDANAIAAAIRSGRTTPLYYGLANGRPFVLMASAGLDAAVVARASPRLKRALGKWAYVASAFALKRRTNTPDLIVTTNKEELRCRLAICANAARYGGDYVIAPRTCATRPGLALVVVTDDSLLALLRIGWRMLSGRGLDGAGVRILDVSEATLAVAQGNEAQEAAAQVDGDPFGVTPVRAVCAEAPVRLV